jgi:hypothetical protein
VPPEKIVTDHAPDGQAYLFMMAGTIQCFVRPARRALMRWQAICRPTSASCSNGSIALRRCSNPNDAGFDCTLDKALMENLADLGAHPTMREHGVPAAGVDHGGGTRGLAQIPRRRLVQLLSALRACGPERSGPLADAQRPSCVERAKHDKFASGVLRWRPVTICLEALRDSLRTGVASSIRNQSFEANAPNPAPTRTG